MAILEMNYKSICLKRFVRIRAVLPFENSGFSYDEKETKYPALYLLHGYTGNEDDWITESSIVREARHRKLAVIMAAADNSFYHDCMDFDSRYAEFIGKELVEVTRQVFPLSEKREETFIAGNSMGGYGALYLGSRYHETFSRIAAFSGAFISGCGKEVLEGTDLINRPQSEYILHFFSKIKQDESLEAALKNMAEDSHRTGIYLTCGSEDGLIERNREMHQYLQTLGMKVTYVEIPGAHDWDTWNKMLSAALDWMKGTDI